jgi:polysaccharide biosynthesis transport protein
MNFMNSNYNQPPSLEPSGGIVPLTGHLRHRSTPTLELSDVKYTIAAIRRQRGFIVMVACLGFVIISGSLLLVVPMYESTARVVIDPPGSEAFSLQSEAQGISEPDYIGTQADILKSEDITIDVVRQLKLDQDPVVMKKDILGTLKERIHLDQLLALLRHKTRRTEISDDTHLSAAEVIALNYVKSHRTVTPVKNSRLIEVSFKTPNPELSSKVANALVNRYVTETYAARYEAVMKSSEWLSRQLDDIRTKAVASNETLANYQKQYGIADIDDKQNNVSEREGELIRQYTQAQADKIQMESYLRRVLQGDVASVPQFRSNPVVQQITEKLVELRGQLSEAEVSYGENHPVVTRLKNQIAELQHQVQVQEQAIVGEIQAGFATANNRAHSLQEEVKDTTLQMSQMSHYAILRREAQANQDLYDALYARVKEAGISAASKSSNITVIDKARVLNSPTWPQLTLMLPIALFVSLIGGVAAGIARDGMDGSVRSVDDVRCVGGDRTLILVPQFATLAPAGPHLSLGRYRFSLSSTKQNRANRLNKFMLDRPESTEAESMRSLLSTLLLAQRQQQLKAILVTSPFPKEGKTTLAYNLALALAEKGDVCFVDADFRKNASLLEPAEGDAPGIFEYCNESISLEQIDSPSGDHANLTVVHSGIARGNPIQTLMSNRFQALIGDLGIKHEFLVVDSPPILPFADARFLAVLTDGAVIVARSAVTDRRSLDTAVGIIDRLSVPILGVALNGVSLKQLPYREYYA